VGGSITYGRISIFKSAFRSRPGTIFAKIETIPPHLRVEPTALCGLNRPLTQEERDMKIRHVLLSIAAMCVLVSGCAQPPADQINAAEQAVKDAQQSGAATYVANDYAKVEGLLTAMKTEVAEQDAKFALLRDYGKAEQLAAAAKTEAERVKADAAKKMEEAKFAATQAQQAAQTSVASTMDLVAKAPAGKDRAALESIKADAEALKASLNDVQMMLDKADYLGAQTKANAIQQKADAVSREIETALAKIGKGKTVAKRK
jgi:hypothetical protein